MSGLHERSYMNKSAVLEYDNEFNKQKTSSIRNRIGRMEQTLSTICALHELFNSDFFEWQNSKNQKIQKFWTYWRPQAQKFQNLGI